MKDPITRNRDPELDYELIGKLGEGSYGSVWKGRDRSTEEVVAVKIVPFDHGDDSDLRKEIEILEKAHDSFIVGYHRSYEKDKQVWIVMELAEAGSVSDLMQICEIALEEGLIKILIASAVLGLDYLHKQKMIHRDIKAGNLLLTRSGHAKLADFGVSATVTTLQSKRNTVIGTPFWMAPEVIQESDYDYKADIWSLGITLIELADREPPFSNIHPMRAIFMIPNRPPSTFQNEKSWSAEMNSFLKRCLVKNPDDRASTTELLAHPFIVNEINALNQANPRGFSPDLKDLVDSCIDEILLNREQQAALQAQAEQQQAAMQNKRKSSVGAGDTAVMVKDGNGNPQLVAGRTRNNDTQQTTAGGDNSTLLFSQIGESSRTLLKQGSKLNALEEPDFMHYFQTKEPSRAMLKLEKHQQDILDKNIARLNAQFKADFKELKNQYQKKKDDLLKSAGA